MNFRQHDSGSGWHDSGRDDFWATWPVTILVITQRVAVMSAMSESINAEKITGEKSYWFRINQQLVENLATRQADVLSSLFTTVWYQANPLKKLTLYHNDDRCILYPVTSPTCQLANTISQLVNSDIFGQLSFHSFNFKKLNPRLIFNTN